MIYRRRRHRGSARAGFFRFESNQRKQLSGFGDGELIRLRDEHGNVWQGHVEDQADDAAHFIFRDHEGQRISGISDRYGVTLRDERGNTWRGYID